MAECLLGDDAAVFAQENAVNSGDRRTDELADLADRIERFDRAHLTPGHIKPSRERSKRPPLSRRERKTRRWVLAAMSVWGGLVFAVVLIQEWGRPLFLIFAAMMVTLCIFVCYGFYLFYAALGKSALRKFSGGKNGD